MLMLTLTGCEEPTEQSAPSRGQEIVLNFSIDSNADINYVPSANAPMRAQVDTHIPGDPGKDDFVPPTNLYFIMWVETLGHAKQIAAVKETGLTASDWEDNGKGIYTLKNKSYKLIIPKDDKNNILQLVSSVFHVFAFASTANLLDGNDKLGDVTFSVFSDADKADGRRVATTTIDSLTLTQLTYAIPSGVTTEAEKRAFFRSMYSTALSETQHNQMATSPTIRLRHTAARLDINWECETVTTGLPHEQTSPLTANSTWTIATEYFPTAFSLFKPGANTGATDWSETLTIDEGMRYNGRYVTYLPMPTTPTFTVTSSDDAINPDGADDVAKKTKTLALSAGSDVNYATWMRALWTIKKQ